MSAQQDPRCPWWRFEFECDGAPFVWQGQAHNRAAAEARARQELTDTFAGYSRYGARLVSCEQLITGSAAMMGPAA